MEALKPNKANSAQNEIKQRSKRKVYENGGSPTNVSDYEDNDPEEGKIDSFSLTMEPTRKDSNQVKPTKRR